jgi:hypothetical protein
MPKKTAVPKNRWTLACDEEISRPKKPSDLAKVVDEYLGPFAHQTQAEALKHGAYFEHNGQRLGISRALASELVEDVARRFNTEKYLERGAPRFKHVMERLNEKKRLVDALIAHMESDDDITRHELQNVGTGTEHQEQFRALMEAADVKALPRVSTDETASGTSWVDRLKSLSSYIDTTSINLVVWRRRQNLSEVDKGGNTNLWKETIGIPRWGLVNDAISIYEMFKPGKATGTESGPFHRFILDLFEYATGREGTDHAKVEDWIKDLVPAHREDKRAAKKEAKLDAEIDEIIFRDPESRTESDLKRVAELKMAVDEIRHKREEYWQIMWPHVRLSRRSSRS